MLASVLEDGDLMAPEYRSLMIVVKKFITMLFIVCLILTKLFTITYILSSFGEDKQLIKIETHLSVFGVLFLIPICYCNFLVRGYTVFLLCAIGSLLIDTVELICIFTIIGSGYWIIFDLGYVALLLFILINIHNIFELKEQQQQPVEEIPLTETINTRYSSIGLNGIGIDRMTDFERAERNLQIWDEFCDEIYRHIGSTRSL
ncbi:Protein CBG09909 [Caenorhabditis briggsae]|uniref:Protein CBG09909 n=2 Tax=Caenorhabditis briggsae TaxID=6238 RepID=A8X9Y2_CAEBR|nr:Protein CBG09909 [Caenorhabditis briggsae]ULU01730.1 hypothetical protein L3Y34_001788 [Caenorhabditis briggsae]CAP29447.1 Protein CBG09909 [Caenorhabditis briggsae]